MVFGSSKDIVVFAIIEQRVFFKLDFLERQRLLIANITYPELSLM